MRNLFFVCVALMVAAPVRAETTRPLKLDQPADSKFLPVKPPKYDASCAAYGAGFVKIDGTNTCVKIGGSISVGAGTNVRRR